MRYFTLFVLGLIQVFSIAQFDLPEAQGEVYHRLDYSIDLNDETRLPNWVCYELRSEMLLKEVENCRKVIHEDIANALSENELNAFAPLFEKGHLKPVAHSAYDQNACEAASLTSNIVPQTAKLNNGLWRSLEKHSTRLAREDSAIQIITGPIPLWIDSLDSGVPVPIGYWKVLVRKATSKGVPVECFVLPQTPEFRDLENYQISLNSLANFLGFMPISTQSAERMWEDVPDQIERTMEMPLFEVWVQSCREEVGGTLDGLHAVGAFSHLLRKAENLLEEKRDSQTAKEGSLRFKAQNYAYASHAANELGFVAKARGYESAHRTLIESIKTCPSKIEYQGHTYETAVVNGACWFAENLQSLHFANGDTIPIHNIDKEHDANSPFTPYRCVYGDLEGVERKKERGFSTALNATEQQKNHGVLYNYSVLKDERDICPTGWRISTWNDWIELGEFQNSNNETLGGLNKLDFSTTEWEQTMASDLSVLSLSYGGYYQDFDEPIFKGLNNEGIWWMPHKSGVESIPPVLAQIERKTKKLTLNKELIPNSLFGDLNGAYSIRCVSESFNSFDASLSEIQWEVIRLINTSYLQRYFIDRISG